MSNEKKQLKMLAPEGFREKLSRRFCKAALRWLALP